jgi:predicted NAD/FAD-binding protein
VQKITAPYADRIRLDCGVKSIRRLSEGVIVTDVHGRAEHFDQVLVAAHGDQALAMLEDPSREESRLLGAFRYTRNVAVLHTDLGLMPRRRAAWSSWNYIGERNDPTGRCVTYWMNRLQSFQSAEPVLLTLNPYTAPDPAKVLRTERYDHPLFDDEAMAAQKQLWSLQGVRRTWFCGAHFGSGFHEDGLQSGLAAAEAIGGVRRPWRVANESGRIFMDSPPAPSSPAELVA